VNLFGTLKRSEIPEEDRLMATIAELFAKYGVEQATLSSSSPRHKALSMANTMLKKLDTYSSPRDLDSSTSNQNWWSGKSKDGRRRITCRYNSKVFPDLSFWCDDTIDAVKNSIQTMKKIINELDVQYWDNEENRRKNIKQTGRK